MGTTTPGPWTVRILDQKRNWLEINGADRMGVVLAPTPVDKPAIVLPVRAEAVHVFESGLCTYDVLDADGKFVCEANDEQTAAELVRMLNERTEMVAMNNEMNEIVNRVADQRDLYAQILREVLWRINTFAPTNPMFAANMIVEVAPKILAALNTTGDSAEAKLAAVRAENSALLKQWNDLDLRNEARHRKANETIDKLHADNERLRSSLNRICIRASNIPVESVMRFDLEEVARESTEALKGTSDGIV